MFCNNLSNFQLPDPTDPDESPKVEPSMITKYDLFQNSSFFKEIDEHAIKVSRMKFSNFRELLWNLTYCKEFNDLEKARICFRWLVTINIYALDFANVQPCSPEYILTGFKRSDGSYSKIYEILCCYSGLHCQLIQGYAKGDGYVPGQNIENDSVNHYWVGVHIFGNWHLMDPLWATRFMERGKGNDPLSSMGSDGQSSLVSDCDEFYFMMDPAQAIFSHFPTNPNWQLLPQRTITSNLFSQMPLVMNQFFRSSLTFNGNHHAVFQVPNGELKLHFGYNSSSSFTYALRYLSGNQLVTKHEGVPINLYSILETQRSDLFCYLRLPFKGEYIFTLYAATYEKQASISNKFRAACTYKLICDNPSANLIPYPCDIDASIGPSWVHFDYYNLSAVNNRTGIVITKETSPTQLEFFFLLHKPETTLSWKLVRRPQNTPLNRQDLEVVPNAVVENERGLEIALVVKINEPGIYCLQLYTKEPQDGDCCNNIGQYLIDSTNNILKRLTSLEDYTRFPNLPNGGLPDPYIFCRMRPRKSSDYSSMIDSYMEIAKKQKGYPEQSSGAVSPIPPESDTKLYSPIPVISAEHNEDALDAYAMGIYNKNPKAIENFLNELFRSLNCYTQADKVRALYQWLCSTNLTYINDSEVTGPNAFFVGIKQNLTTYTQVFHVVCQISGIVCKHIVGYAKGSAYKSGDKLSPLATHSWNVVQVDNVWFHVDCHWGAKCLYGLSKDDARVRYSVDEFYCMPPPEQFIYSHLPHDNKWQLLQSPISPETFEQMVLFKSSFFKYQLRMLTYNDSVINATNDLILKMGFQNEYNGKLFFKFLLTHENGGDFYALPVNRYVIQEIQNTTSQVSYQFRFPTSGVYRFHIFVRTLDIKEYIAVVEYAIRVQVTHRLLFPFPPCQPCYGYTKWAVQLNVKLMEMQYESRMSCSKGGQQELNFQFPVSGYGNPMKMFAVLKNDYVSKLSLEDMLQYKTYPVDQYTHQFTVKCNLQKQEMYGLEIYANNPQKDKSMYYLVWQILLQVR